MKANDRIEQLLIKARETIADIPPVTEVRRGNVEGVIADEYGTYSEENALRYIVCLSEIIDRMERGIDNLLHGAEDAGDAAEGC